MRFCDNDNLGALLYVDAFDLALQAHKNQVDKCGEPYFLHPMLSLIHISEPTRQSR